MIGNSRKCDHGRYIDEEQCPNCEEIREYKERIKELEAQEARCHEPFDPEGSPDTCEHVIERVEPLRTRIRRLEVAIVGVLATDDPDGFDERMEYLRQIFCESEQ